MTRRLLLLLLAALAAVAATPFLGRDALPMSAVTDLAGVTPDGVILWHIRVPRVLAACIAGAALALGGAAFQALFRNPLAAPFTLGVASGAAFGVALATRLGLVAIVVGVPTSTLAALAGALLAVATVWGLARLRPQFSTSVLLLAGVAMSFFFSSLILFLQYSASLGNAYRIVRWLMGGLAAVDLAAAVSMIPFVLVGAAIVAWHTRELDLMATGAEIAASRGVAVVRTRKLVFVATSLMVGGVVAVCGPIGFVGLMAPHICRLVVGAEHRYLLPAACVFGGAFLAVCDTLARTLIAPAELPVGVITSFLGGPFFLWLLLRGDGVRM
jgi:iron complex transport system permease protein